MLLSNKNYAHNPKTAELKEKNLSKTLLIFLLQAILAFSEQELFQPIYGYEFIAKFIQLSVDVSEGSL